MDKRKLLFILIPIIWALVIWGVVGYNEYKLQTGREITLITVPIDPPDFFRGDYVTLNYKISNFDHYFYDSFYDEHNGDVINNNADSYHVGDTVYVTINGENQKYDTPDISKTKPDSYKNIFIKGTIKSMSEVKKTQTVNTPVYEPRVINFRIDYGIETYFIPEKTGAALVKKAQKGDLQVKVSVDKNGVASVKSIL